MRRYGVDITSTYRGKNFRGWQKSDYRIRQEVVSDPHFFKIIREVRDMSAVS